MHVFTEHRTRPQPRIGAHASPRAHNHTRLFAIDMREGMDDCASGNPCIADDAVRPNGNAVPEHHIACEDAVHVDVHVGPAGQSSADV